MSFVLVSCPPLQAMYATCMYACEYMRVDCKGCMYQARWTAVAYTDRMFTLVASGRGSVPRPVLQRVGHLGVRTLHPALELWGVQGVVLRSNTGCSANVAQMICSVAPCCISTLGGMQRLRTGSSVLQRSCKACVPPCFVAHQLCAPHSHACVCVRVGGGR